jgi:hypothetical protein
MCASGSCIKAVKQKQKWFPTEKKMLSPVAVQNQNGHFSVLGIQYTQNYKLTPAPSEIASQFPPPRTFEQIPRKISFGETFSFSNCHIIGQTLEISFIF